MLMLRGTSSTSTSTSTSRYPDEELSDSESESANQEEISIVNELSDLNTRLREIQIHLHALIAKIPNPVDEAEVETNTEPTAYTVSTTSPLPYCNLDNYCKERSTAVDDKIVESFSSLVGMKYTEALEYATESGYKLHVLYVGHGVRQPREGELDDKVLGIRIYDPSYDFYHRCPSDRALVEEVIDVGGVDATNKGLRTHPKSE